MDWIFLLSILYFIKCPSVFGNVHILYDSISVLPRFSDWYLYTFSEATSGFLVSQDMLWRCDQINDNAEAWAISPFIPRHESSTLTMQINFTMLGCSQITEDASGDSTTCRDFFDIYYLESNLDVSQRYDVSMISTSQPPPDEVMPREEWGDASRWHKLQRIAGEHYDLDGANRDVVNQLSITTGKLNSQYSGVYFFVKDVGSCLSLVDVRLFHNYCPTVTQNLATFPLTISDNSKLEEVRGSCVAHASASEPPHMICQPTGEWHTGTAPSLDPLNPDACTCDPGYAFSSQLATCTACQSGWYKSQADNTGCSPCPANSWSNSGASSCHCILPHKRASHESPDMPCATPPGQPMNLTGESDHTIVHLSWLPPLDDGGRDDVWYSIHCDRCDHTTKYHCINDTEPHPNLATCRSLSAWVSRLEAHTPYKFSVTAKNSVSHLGREYDSSAAVEIETGDLIRVTDVALELVSPESFANTSTETRPSLHLSWNPPSYHADPVDFPTLDGYVVWMLKELALYRSFEINSTTITRLVIDEFDEAASRDYSLQVAVIYLDSRGVWNEGGPVSLSSLDSAGVTPSSSGATSGLDTVLLTISQHYAKVIVALAFLLILIVIFCTMSFYYCLTARGRKWKQIHKLYEYSASPTGTASTARGGCYPLSLANGGSRNEALLQTHKSGAGNKTYVDPTIYEDPDQLVRSFTKELDAASLSIQKVIGGGEFGDVCRGTLHLPGSSIRVVAIKTLKAEVDASSEVLEKARRDFLAEASLMGQFSHPNVIHLLGVVTKAHPLMIVTEFMENGSLNEFLKSEQLQPLQLTSMVRGVAAGMTYLSEMGYVHRDLAARNVLVNSELICKICDFGLSRVLEEVIMQEYTTKGGKIPIRWTAPEAISYRTFTSASDVWSFGIVMWETFSFGERPYWNWTNKDVIAAVEQGYRLPPPRNTPQPMYQLMLECWQANRALRPRFKQIKDTLNRLIQTAGTLDVMATSRIMSPFGENLPDMRSFRTVGDWLHYLKLEQYQENFERQGLYTMLDLLAVTYTSLEGLGVRLVGHKKKLINSIQCLKEQVGAHQSASESDNFQLINDFGITRDSNV